MLRFTSPDLVSAFPSAYCVTWLYGELLGGSCAPPPAVVWGRARRGLWERKNALVHAHSFLKCLLRARPCLCQALGIQWWARQLFFSLNLVLNSSEAWWEGTRHSDQCMAESIQNLQEHMVRPDGSQGEPEGLPGGCGDEDETWRAAGGAEWWEGQLQSQGLGSVKQKGRKWKVFTMDRTRNINGRQVRN